MSEIDALLASKNLGEMLQYETQIFLDILHQDGLVVAAKGLTLDCVLLNLLKVYCDPGNLVIVLNCSESEENYYVSKLNNENVHRTTCTTSISEREDVYLSGGIHFITTRILVLDMLKKRIPIEKITGMIVLRAHTVLESCQEAFVLRLYRQNNKTGFVKAFSNSAQSFTVGFGHVERVMRTVFVKELFIWPRFHSLVIQTLKQHEPTVVELHVPISQMMSKIQICILDLMNLTMKELKRINRTLELQEITVENCLTKKFHKILQLQLDCVWNQLSSKSKQLITDLKTLRHLIINMFYSDPVTFYSTICKYRSMEYAQNATWVLQEPAELLFTYANSLVFTGDKEFNPEFCPKWKTLAEILKVEVPAECKKLNITDCKVLILAQDNMMCHQLNHFLSQGPQHYLLYTALMRGVHFKSISKAFKNVEDLQKSFTQTQVADKTLDSPKHPKKSKLDSEAGEEESNKEEPEEKDCIKCSYVLTMTQSLMESHLGDEETTDGECLFEPFDEIGSMDLTQICEATRNKPTILIQTFKPSENFFSLQKTLEDIQPNFVIMYHSNVSAIREIELYEARRSKGNPLKIYFLIHAETVEEQSYLTALRREKEAFENLIDAKSTMVVPDDQDGKSEQCASLQRESNIPVVNTRKGGKTEGGSQKKTIIVDMREFRSELPALIHKRGIEIEPLTITIGDYIITSEICVERKSLSDLIGSLNSGRLYQQCTQMSRYYTKPMLLIEFDQNKSFSWQNSYMLSSDSKSFDIQQKLLLLTLHFPKLKIVWSPSPYASAQLFEELKEGKDEPSVQYALATGGENDLDVIETKYNSSIYDFVQKLPGITSKNIDYFLRQMKNMDNVVKKSEDGFKEILGNAVDAKAFYNILHTEHKVEDIAETSKGKNKPKSKFKFIKGKK